MPPAWKGRWAPRGARAHTLLVALLSIASPGRSLAYQSTVEVFEHHLAPGDVQQPVQRAGHHSAVTELLQDLLGPGQSADPREPLKSRRAYWEHAPRQLIGSIAVTLDALCAVGGSDFNPFKANMGLSHFAARARQQHARRELSLLRQDPTVPTTRNRINVNPMDVFDVPDSTPSDRSYTSVGEVARRDWIVLAAATVGFIVVELFFMRHLGDSVASHAVNLIIWLVFACLFNLYIYAGHGASAAFDWASGYALEWMLSVDNLFVFHIVFQSYKVPQPQIRKALYVGIVSAVILRLCFFAVLSDLLSLFQWVRVPFGLLLIWSGIETARADDDDDEGDLEDTRLVRFLRSCLGSRLYKGYDEEGHGLFMFDGNGRLRATMLLMVVVCLEVSDILFAVDSVSAKVAQIQDQYMAFSSSVLAMFGLRSMFFLVADLVDLFKLLKYGLCVILIFIGIELILAPFISLSSSTVLILIVAVFAVSIFASVAYDSAVVREASKQLEEAADKVETSPEDT